MAGSRVRSIGYIRVSTDRQGERGYGLDAQKLVIRAEAKHRGWALGRIYVDVASGSSMRRRAEMKAALSALEAREADVLIVSKLDRLSRSLIDFAGIMRTSRAQGWGLVAVDIGVDTSTTNGELIANIIMSLAQWERRIIGERTRAALAAVKARGKQLGRPTSVTPEAVAIIEAMRKSGASYRAVAETLNRAGTPTPQGGREWYASTVRAIEGRLSA